MNASKRFEVDEGAEVVEGPGKQLRAAREAQFLEVDKVATQLRLSKVMLKAIEADDYAHLPGPVFVQGYLRNYARLLNEPADEILAAYYALMPDREPRVDLRVAQGKTELRSSHTPVQIVTWIIVIGIFALLMIWWKGYIQWPPGLATGEWGPTSWQQTKMAAHQPEEQSQLIAPLLKRMDEAFTSIEQEPPPSLDQSEPKPEILQESEPEPEILQESEPEPEILQESEPEPEILQESEPEPEILQESELESEVIQESSSDLETAQELSPEPAPVGSSALEPSLVEEAQSGETPAVAEGGETPRAQTPEWIVMLEFSGDSWVDVRDAEDRIQISRLVSEGDIHLLKGTPPFKVVLGNVAGVKVTMNGQPFELATYAQGNVARFTLDPRP